LLAVDDPVDEDALSFCGGVRILRAADEITLRKIYLAMAFRSWDLG
jgi:hypothetical protein